MKTYLLLIAACLTSCAKHDSDDVNTLLELHAQQREAHFENKAALMLNQAGGNLITLNRGKIDTVYSRTEDSLRFTNYFSAVKFKKWDDLTPPKIRFSDDHSLAYMIVDKLVVFETTDTTGKNIEEQTHFAWVNIFRKNDLGEWKSECIISTNEESIIK